MQDTRSAPLAATITEACRVSHLSRSTLYALIRTGQLRSTRIGKRRLVMLDSLREVLEAGARL